MKVPNEMRIYCPKCRRHTLHKIKEYKEGRRRSTAWGQFKHERKTWGYTSKVAGQVMKKKQRKQYKVLAQCKECGKKVERVYPHSKKRLEVKKKEA